MVQVYINERGKYFQLRSEGHANFAKDNDIVCAGVSALVYAWLEYCLREQESGHLTLTQEAFEPGEVNLITEDRTGVTVNGRKPIIAGLELMANTYPMNVRITRGEMPN